MPEDSNTIATLKRSQQPRELARAAQTLAASRQGEDHRALLEFLKAEEFRQRLDPATEIDTGPDDRWLAKPLRSLAANSAPSAHAVLVELMADAGFTSDEDGVDLLVTASASLRPPPGPVIQFWRKHATMDSVHLNGIVAATLENGDAAAVAEFERILLKAERDEDGSDLRLIWLRGPLLKHRDNPDVLAMAERLVAKAQPPGWTQAMQTALAEALFLHKPSWYRPHQIVLPPPRAKTPREGRETLRRIADQVRKHLQPSAALEAGIAAALVELDALKDRRP